MIYVLIFCRNVIIMVFLNSGLYFDPIKCIKSCIEKQNKTKKQNKQTQLNLNMLHLNVYAIMTMVRSNRFAVLTQMPKVTPSMRLINIPSQITVHINNYPIIHFIHEQALYTVSIIYINKLRLPQVFRILFTINIILLYLKESSVCTQTLVFKGARSDCFRFFSNFERFWYQKKAIIFLITPCEFYS